MPYRSAALVFAASLFAFVARPVADEVADGAQLFIKLGCGWCHEDGGRQAGKGPQLMNTKRTDDYMMNRIATGRTGKMPAFGNSLDGRQLDALLAYIRSLKPSA
jgi:mono/diheme cytochrome c family protein